MTRKLATTALMTNWTLALLAWLSTLGAAAGIVLVFAGEAEAGVAILTGAILTPISYLVGRITGVNAERQRNGQNGKP